MDDNTKNQLAYEEAVMQIRDAVREMSEAGIDFTKKAVRQQYKKQLVDTMKKVANDKRIFS